MHDHVSDANMEKLYMFDVEDEMIRSHHLNNDSAKTAFEPFLRKWIPTIDAPVFTAVDRGPNLSSAYMDRKFEKKNPFVSHCNKSLMVDWK